MTDLAIVIVAYKTRDVLDACLRSLAADRRLSSAQIVVVDNASGDGTPDMVRAKYPGVLLIVNEKNAGYSVANNQGIRATASRHVLLLNPDTEAPEGVISGMADFLDRYPRVGFVGCQLLNTDGTDQQSWYPLPLPLSRYIEKKPWYPRLARRALGIRDAEPEPSGNSAFRVDIVKGACLMVRREALDAAGLMDEASFLYADDIDLCIRLRRAGWDACLLPNLKMTHHGYVSTGQEVFLTIVSSRRSALYLYRKHFPTWMVFFWSLFIYAEILYKWMWNRIRLSRRPGDSRVRERWRAFRVLGREILGFTGND